MTKAESLGIKFLGEHGKRNSIVDVDGLEIGHETLIYDIENEAGNISVRTGVSAILPQGKNGLGTDFFCGASTLNGNGEVTGLSWIEESGMLSGPIMLTNTYSVGVVRDAALKWMTMNRISNDALPVVCEISDEFLNDIRGHYITDSHVFSAIEKASTDNLEEGSVGGGTGAVCYEFKGGIGTSSRKIRTGGGEYTVGVMVQANHGLRHQLTIKGVPVGLKMKNDLVRSKEEGSIVMIVATDAPLLPHQLKRLSKRTFLGLARTGSISSDSSGDFSIAFSVANKYQHGSYVRSEAHWLSNVELDPLFEGIVQATEESVINALVSADSMSGYQGHHVAGISREELKNVFRK